jgi:hypothetical protein
MRDGEAIARTLGGKREGRSWKFHCPCPGHNDSTPSCSLRDDGLLHCFGGCDRAEVEQALDALGFTDDKKRTTPIDPALEAWRREQSIKLAQWEWNNWARDDEAVQIYLRYHRQLRWRPSRRVSSLVATALPLAYSN